MRTDKPKYKGQFINQVCKQSTLIDKPVKYFDVRCGEWRFGKVTAKSSALWVWNGEDWILQVR